MAAKVEGYVVLILNGLDLDYTYCAVCCMMQKSWFLSKQESQDAITRLSEEPGKHTLIINPNKNMPLEVAVTRGLSTLTSIGTVDVCMTHLLNFPDQNAVMPGKKLLIGDGLMKYKDVN
jgi:hypothetical protein